MICKGQSILQSTTDILAAVFGRSLRARKLHVGCSVRGRFEHSPRIGPAPTGWIPFSQPIQSFDEEARHAQQHQGYPDFPDGKLN